MNLRDALLAASDHGTDRLSVDADRRLRRRLGLESAPARRVWLRPAIAVGALAVVAAAALLILQTGSSPSARVATTGLVDVSKHPWSGTVTPDALDVHATSATSATVTWSNATIIAAPGTRLATRTDGGLALGQGAIQLQRSEATPLVVDVPMGRVVIASFRSSIAIDRDSVTILLDDGGGTYTDAAGQSHPLAPGASQFPPAQSPDVDPGSADEPDAPALLPPPKAPRPRERATIPPGAAQTVPADASGPPGLSVPRRPDMPCTYKSDCEPGATCRKNEDGESVCMGNGAAGAACWFDTDCLSRSCNQRRCTSAP